MHSAHWLTSNTQCCPPTMATSIHSEAHKIQITCLSPAQRGYGARATHEARCPRTAARQTDGAVMKIG